METGCATTLSAASIYSMKLLCNGQVSRGLRASLLPRRQQFRYQFGPLALDATRRVLLRERERVPLSSKSVDVLLTLLTRHGETVSKGELLEAVWPGSIVEENSLNQSISEIRKALGERRAGYVELALKMRQLADGCAAC